VNWSGSAAAGWPASERLIVPITIPGAGRFVAGCVPDGTGGAYVGWQSTADPNAADDDLYAIRFLADGSVAPGWPAGGYPVAAYSGYQTFGKISADSTGDMLLTWSDGRAYPPLVYLLRLQGNGTPAPGWQVGGNPVSTVSGYQFAPRLAPDGLGGAFVSFQEAFGDHGYVQRIVSSGSRARGWPSDGVALVDPSISGATQQNIVITPDGSGGAITVWEDFRDGLGNKIYGQRYTGQDITGALTSLVSYEALPGRVTLRWSRGDDTPGEVSVERGVGEAWTQLGLAKFDGSGRLDYEDRSVQGGRQYSYRLGWLDAGVERHTAEVAVDVPREVALALQGLRPNPAVSDLNIAFSLPNADPATLEVLDIGGRLMLKRAVGSLGAGRHVVRMDEGGPLHPGAYWLRLTHDGQRLLAKGVVLR
jgi:hypothetical protein